MKTVYVPRYVGIDYPPSKDEYFDTRKEAEAFINQLGMEDWIIITMQLDEKKMKSVYVPMYNADSTEGRGPMVCKDFGFSNKQDAEEYIDTQPGVMGRKAKWSRQNFGDWEIKEIQVYDNLNDLEQGENERLKQSALAKLTNAERRALGL